jgi:hypothetical protein
MLNFLIVVAIILAWNGGYWVGRIHRPSQNWDWRPTALQNGWVHKLYLSDPEHHDEMGRYKYWGD